MATLYLPVVSFLRDFEPLLARIAPGSAPSRRDSTRKVGCRACDGVHLTAQLDPAIRLAEDEVQHLLLVWMHLLKTVDTTMLRYL